MSRVDFPKKVSGALIKELVTASKEYAGVSDLPEMTEAQIMTLRYYLRREVLREKIRLITSLLTEI